MNILNLKKDSYDIVNRINAIEERLKQLDLDLEHINVHSDKSNILKSKLNLIENTREKTDLIKEHNYLLNKLDEINGFLDEKYSKNQLALIIDKFLESLNRDDFKYLESIFESKEIEIPKEHLAKATEGYYLARILTSILEKIKNINK